MSNPFIGGQSAMTPFTPPEQRDLERRQRIAEMLRMQAARPTDTGTQMAGGWAIPNSPVAPFERLGQALIASRSQSRVDADEDKYMRDRQQKLVDALKGYGKDGNAEALLNNPDTAAFGLEAMMGDRKLSAEADQAAMDRRAEENAAMQDRMAEFERAQLDAAARVEAARLRGIGGINGAQPPANVQEYQFFSKLSPDEQQRYLTMKRSSPFVDTGDARVMPDPLNPAGPPIASFPINPGPEQRPEYRAEVAGAEAGARASAEAAAQQSANQRAKQETFALYEAARDGLISGLGSADTGPLVGRVPALTTGQQRAEGGVAAMAPVLKQIFRVAGEGTFTDKDQEMLLNMIPTRKDTPEARASKIANIDSIVRAKLGVGAQRPASDGFSISPSQSPDPLGIR
jgi:hypothetical protein